MQTYKIEDFFKGWVVGNFQPSLHLNSNFEVGVKHFNAGEVEAAHKQLVATEITIVVSGKIRLASGIFSDGDIISIPPNEVADFEALSDCALVCIKFPSLPNDKVVV
jgi:quercetin dioxygenase-like cupin family protein